MQDLRKIIQDHINSVSEDTLAKIAKELGLLEIENKTKDLNQSISDSFSRYENTIKGLAKR